MVFQWVSGGCGAPAARRPGNQGSCSGLIVLMQRVRVRAGTPIWSWRARSSEHEETEPGSLARLVEDLFQPLEPLPGLGLDVGQLLLKSSMYIGLRRPRATCLPWANDRLAPMWCG